MARWSEVVAAEPEFARQVRAHFSVNKYQTLATLRRDGSPRISGCNIVFTADGDLWIYAMPGAVRAADLRRDPRLAVHSPTGPIYNDDLSDWADWSGDAKITGYGIETVIDWDAGIEWDSDIAMNGSHMDPKKAVRDYSMTGFRIDVKEVVRTYGRGDDIVIESWHEGRRLRRRERCYTGGFDRVEENPIGDSLEAET